MQRVKMSILRKLIVLILISIFPNIFSAWRIGLLLTHAITPALAVETAFSYRDYARVLTLYVNASGLVNYSRLKEDRDFLDRFAADLGAVKLTDYQSWQEKEKIAFWINAYNALTLRVIIDHYPIESSLFTSLIYASNSIRQIDGVWEKLQVIVMGKPTTLGQIEHEVLGRRFSEPRVRLALVSASLGGPSLRNEPYSGENLDRQFDDQVRKFLADPEKCSVIPGKSKVKLSPIFKWYGEDFIKGHPETDQLNAFSPAEQAVLGFISRYLDQEKASFINTGKYKIKYLGYDWSLNEQKE